MPRIGTFELDSTTTVIDTRTEFVLGRVRRVTVLTLFLTRFTDRDDFSRTLDDLEKEVERLDRGETDFSIRTGRMLRGRRRKWVLTRDEDRCTAVARLEVLGEDRYEYGETENLVSFSITSSPQNLDLTVGGNWNALPILKLTASGNLADPVFSDGVRTLSCNLSLAAAETLEIDSESRTVTKNGDEDVFPSVTGDFPEPVPGSTSLVYSDSTSGTPSASLEIRWRDRWV